MTNGFRNESYRFRIRIDTLVDGILKSRALTFPSLLESINVAKMATEEQVAVCAPSEISHSQCSYQSKKQIPKSVLCHYHRVSVGSDRNQFPGCLLIPPTHEAGNTHHTHAGDTNSPDDIHFIILHSLSHSFSSGIPHWHPLLERGLFRKSIPTQSTLPSLSDMDDIRFIFPSTIASLR